MKYSHRHPGKYGSNTPNGKYVYKKRPMHVQTLIFPKNRFTRKKAIDWAKEHGFKGLTSREEGNSIRVRQFSPEDVKRYGGTFPIGKDVKGVYAEVKLEKYKNKDYKYLKDKFNISKTGDDDKDKVINKDDCRPWDKKRHMAWDLEGANEELHKVEYMSPQEYIKRTGLSMKDLEKEEYRIYYDTEKGKSEDIDVLGEHITDPSKKVRIPYVGDPSIITEHEGRHRAYAAMKKGIKEIPVAVPLERSEREKLAERFIERAFPDSDNSYKSEWRERFEKGFPESSMDKERRKIYKEILDEMDFEEPD